MCPLREPRLVVALLILGLRQDWYTISLGHLVMTESKEVHMKNENFLYIKKSTVSHGIYKSQLSPMG